MRNHFAPILAAIVCSALLLHAAAAQEKKAKEPYESITKQQIDSIDYEDASVDEGFVGPLAKDLSHLDDLSKKRMEDIEDALEKWEPGFDRSISQQVRNFIALCTLADLAHGEFEAELPHVIFTKMRRDIPTEQLRKSLAWIILKPAEGKVILKAPEITGSDEPIDERAVRERSILYAKKLLGRLQGKLPLER